MCEACHSKVPGPGEDGDAPLRGRSIDATCMGCHELGQCVPGHGHCTTHPSGRRWNPARVHRPTTLPLFGGRITCATCHRHRLEDGDAPFLLRRVRFDGAGFDYSELCRECHVGY
ncbi:hypothetical protein G3N55_11630 [Dissulfurirhabdus thermomarina]|uniref:Tetrahaem cytochrome domain-containing protein n=1 Tax=Dissulfurirhabdus thermomarina TaxID=1765737 RepID=A0A6N9TYD8_DISTH|nr:hypothetical protein [Dissulfurirhabdus thermomarina]